MCCFLRGEPVFAENERYVGTAEQNQNPPHKVGRAGDAVDDIQDYAPSTAEDQSSVLDYVLVLVRYACCLFLLFPSASTNYIDFGRLVAILWCVYSTESIHP